MSIAHLTFVDIETVPSTIDPSEYFLKKYADEIEKAQFDVTLTFGDVSPNYRYGEASKFIWGKRSALHAEFGKVVAISIGKMVTEKIPLSLEEQSEKQKPSESIDKFYIRSLTGRDEKALLIQAAESIQRAGGTLCAHNGLEFDFPFLMRRFMINGLPIPSQLDVAETKPWDVKLRDTMKMWSGTAWNYRVSLELLCHVLGVDSHKDGMSGEDVAKIYYDSFKEVEGELPFDTKSKALKKIGNYCNGDVLDCANCYSRMKGFPLIENVEYV